MEAASEEIKKDEKPQGPKKFVVGIQYRRAGKIYTFLTDDKTIGRGDAVVVEGEHGSSIGTVIIPPCEVNESELAKDIKRVLHRATPEELEEAVLKSERELHIFGLFVEKTSALGLPMKPLSAELRDNEKKVLLTFFAEDRVDFRSLVKDLATTLHKRIEMHQIGARDEAKYKGCIGPCGFVTCCSQHLRQFQSISIQMAKNQGLTPNPAKLTGMCGKLKCCLAYENALYVELRHRLPRVGMLVKTPQGNGKITGLDVLREQCVVKLDEGGDVRVSVRDVAPQGTRHAAETERAKDGVKEASEMERSERHPEEKQTKGKKDKRDRK